MKHARRKSFNWVYTVFYVPIFLWAAYLVPRLGILLLDAGSVAELDKVPLARWFLPGAIISTVVAVLIYLGVLALKKQHEKRWQALLIKTGVAQIDALTPYEFEGWVARALGALGYRAEVTQKARDYGADVIAVKEGRKIAIQVKKYQKAVGIHAVQEVVSAIGYYDCAEGWVVTSAQSFTAAAKNLARKHNIKLVTKNDLAVRLDHAQK